LHAEDQFIEDMGLYFEEQGVTRMAGRMLAWLLICDPPEQTMPEIVARLGASKGAISTSARLLMQFDLVERISRRGIRADFYRIAPNFGDKVMGGAVKKFAAMRIITERGLALLRKNPPVQSEQLQDLHDIYLFLEERFPTLLAEWRAQRESTASTSIDHLQGSL
jgi:DNA-binding transcriptional regulator GbsR (MarR family)